MLNEMLLEGRATKVAASWAPFLLTLYSTKVYLNFQSFFGNLSFATLNEDTFNELSRLNFFLSVTGVC